MTEIATAVEGRPLPAVVSWSWGGAVALAAALLLAPGLLPWHLPAHAAGQLTVVSETALSDRLVEYVVHSEALQRETPVRVLLPTGYEQADRRYPVLYLLHGCCDDWRSWSDKTDLEAFTADLDVIVVMPDAGAAGFYSDWFNNGLGGPPRWHRHHIGEVVPWVDATFRTRAERSGRLLAGLSMGGFGSFSYAARHPDLFVSAAAYSPAVDTNVGEGALDLLTPLDDGLPGSIWGQRLLEEVRWRGANPWDLAENLAPLDLWLITGDGTDETGMVVDPVEALVHQMATNVHEELTRLGIDHMWDDYGPGTHSWDHWQDDLHRTLPQQLAVAASRPADPTTFAFRSVDAHYEIFGWDVEVDRDIVEFSRLAVTESGFELAGSGTATVTTLPRFRADQEVAVTVDGQRRAYVADHRGRLHIPLDLGPANAVQQYRGPDTTTVTTASVTWVASLSPAGGGADAAPTREVDDPPSSAADTASAPLPSTGGGAGAAAGLVLLGAGIRWRRARSAVHRPV